MIKIIILFIICFIIFLLIINWLVDWICHLIMTKKNNVKSYWGNYNSFKKEFNKINWEYNIYGYGSLFKDHLFGGYPIYFSSQYHVNIIRLNGKGIYLDPVSWVLSKLYVKKYIKENFKGDE
ncbi:MAG: hypothetical protein ACOCRK_10865, partial [bacterium]